MKLTKIKVNNFRNYQSEHEIDLELDDDKNIILVHADNGFGKTSLLDAVLFCFYGIDSTGNIVKFSEYMNKEARFAGKTYLSASVEFEMKKMYII